MLIMFDIPSRDRVIRDDDDDDDAAAARPSARRRVCIILWRVNNICYGGPTESHQSAGARARTPHRSIAGVTFPHTDVRAEDLCLPLSLCVCVR